MRHVKQQTMHLESVRGLEYNTPVLHHVDILQGFTLVTCFRCSYTNLPLSAHTCCCVYVTLDKERGLRAPAKLRSLFAGLDLNSRTEPECATILLCMDELTLDIEYTIIRNEAEVCYFAVSVASRF
jgi:hypothetical protein